LPAHALDASDIAGWRMQVAEIFGSEGELAG
jgi:hypothetical protein